MGREVRMVPKDWEHPRRENGSFQPMYNRDYETEFDEWLEEKKQWKNGLQKDWLNGGFKLKDDEYKNIPFEEWSGAAPDSKYYIPKWKPEERTHYMMYEDTSEGTPISPAFPTPEELAKWLAENNASCFADMTATYEEWLSMIKGSGYSVAMVAHDGIIESGVKFQARQDAEPKV